MYEAFISFKNLDSKDAQTRDSAIAYQLYNMLTSAGIPTFFSNAEIQRKADPRYASLIDTALRESKVIIVVGTQLEYVESRWVEYEWRYFSTQINSGADKYMVTVMDGFRLSDLPPAFAQVQNYSPQNLEGAADMVCGILGKRRPLPVPQPAQQPIQQPVQQAAQPVVSRPADAASTKKSKKMSLIITAAALAAAIIAGIMIPQLPLTVSTKTTKISASAAVGDRVYFGSYPKTADGKIKPIEWRVLKVQDGKALMISEYLLDARRYDDDSGSWMNSELRDWLNSDFYNTAFSAEEQQKLSDINGDKVSLLTVPEAEAYFKDDEDRMAAPTDYAVKRGASESVNLTLDSGEKTGWWWIRSLGSYSDISEAVNTGGGIHELGDKVSNADNCIRPVILVSL